jgi:5'-3' exonuclease
MNNILLIDTSYTAFHRFFATLRWFSFSNKDIYKEHKDDKTYDWSKNNIFIEKYEKMFLGSIEKLVKPKIFKNSIVIFCLDAPQNTLWRNDLHECYKGERVDLTEKFNFKPTFFYTYNHLIPNLIKNNKNLFSINYANMEADDIIALCTRYIRKKHIDKNIYIVSGDNDFLQLGFDKLYFADYKKNNIFQLSKEQAKNELLLKIINGDCSDNIPSIFPKDEKLSIKEKKEIRKNKDKLREYLNNNEKANTQYIKNKKLINFKYIPEKYHKPIYKKIKKILTINF